MISEKWLLPIAGIALMIGFAVSLIAALATADWRYLIITAFCYVLIAAK